MAAPDVKGSISCIDCLNAMFHCFGPFHQFDRYYKDGTLDDCKRQMRELRFCVKLKFADPATTKVRGARPGHTAAVRETLYRCEARSLGPLSPSIPPASLPLADHGP
jgi:hypothetical protein